MSHKVELDKRLKRLMDKKDVMQLGLEDWKAENQAFNEWIQITLGVKNHKGELHLAELLSLWEGLNNGTTETTIADT